MGLPRKITRQPGSSVRDSEPRIPAADPFDALKKAIAGVVEHGVKEALRAPPVLHEEAPPPSVARPSAKPHTEPPLSAGQRAVVAENRAHALQLFTEHDLTPREVEMGLYLLQGYTNEEIVHLGHLSGKTVKAHITSIFRKFKVASRAELMSRIFPV